MLQERALTLAHASMLSSPCSTTHRICHLRLLNLQVDRWLEQADDRTREVADYSVIVGGLPPGVTATEVCADGMLNGHQGYVCRRGEYLHACNVRGIDAVFTFGRCLTRGPLQIGDYFQQHFGEDTVRDKVRARQGGWRDGPLVGRRVLQQHVSHGRHCVSKAQGGRALGEGAALRVRAVMWVLRVWRYVFLVASPPRR